MSNPNHTSRTRTVGFRMKLDLWEHAETHIKAPDTLTDAIDRALRQSWGIPTPDAPATRREGDGT